MELFIGLTLKEARDKKGLTLSKAAKDTKINVKYLEALENEDFDAIPSPGYVKIYLNNYGRYLDLDVAELLKHYETRGKTIQLSRLNLKDDLISVRTKSVSGTYLAILVVVLLFTLGIYLFSRYWRPTPEGYNAPAAVEETGVPLEIMATGETWLRLFIDGELKFEGFLYKGARPQWEVKENFRIRIGNVYNTELKFDNQPVDILSPSKNAVVELSRNREE